jgi:hypothetical protein
MQSSSVFNPYKSSTLEGNWYEERFFHADTRRDEPDRCTRPLSDELEHAPRVTRLYKGRTEVFQPDAVDPNDHYMTVSQATYVRHRSNEESVTARRMNTSPEELQRMLTASPQQFIPDHRLPHIPPEQRFKSEYQKSYVRHF